MNERIKALIEQATTEEHDGFRYFDKKKFAELIVRATMQEVERYAESTDNFSMYECAAQVYPKFIDLGVEE
jgi:hypothetical protein